MTKRKKSHGCIKHRRAVDTIDSTRVPLKDTAGSQKSATFRSCVRSEQGPYKRKGKNTPCSWCAPGSVSGCILPPTPTVFSGFKVSNLRRRLEPPAPISAFPHPCKRASEQDAYPPHPSNCPGGPRSVPPSPSPPSLSSSSLRTAASSPPRPTDTPIPTAPLKSALPTQPQSNPQKGSERGDRDGREPENDGGVGGWGGGAGEPGGRPTSPSPHRSQPRSPREQPRPGCCEEGGGGRGWGRASGGRAGVRPTSVFTWAEAGCGGVPAVVAAGGGCCCCCCCCG